MTAKNKENKIAKELTLPSIGLEDSRELPILIGAVKLVATVVARDGASCEDEIESVTSRGRSEKGLVVRWRARMTELERVGGNRRCLCTENN